MTNEEYEQLITNYHKIEDEILPQLQETLEVINDLKDDVMLMNNDPSLYGDIELDERPLDDYNNELSGKIDFFQKQLERINRSLDRQESTN